MAIFDEKGVYFRTFCHSCCLSGKRVGLNSWTPLKTRNDVREWCIVGCSCFSSREYQDQARKRLWIALRMAKGARDDGFFTELLSSGSEYVNRSDDDHR